MHVLPKTYGVNSNTIDEDSKFATAVDNLTEHVRSDVRGPLILQVRLQRRGADTV